MAEDSPQGHEEIPQLTNEEADAWHYQDIGEDVTGHLTEFVDCGEQPDEDGAPLPVSEGVNPGVLACPQCDFGCFYEVVMEWHARVSHLATPKHSCKICGIPRNSRPSLIHHLKSAHNILEVKLSEPDNGMYQEDPTDLTKFICNFCVSIPDHPHANYVSENDVIAHIHYDHFGVGAHDTQAPSLPFICPIVSCSAAFYSKTEFNSHSNTRHSGFFPELGVEVDLNTEEAPSVTHGVQDDPDFPLADEGSVYTDRSGYEDNFDMLPVAAPDDSLVQGSNEIFYNDQDFEPFDMEPEAVKQFITDVKPKHSKIVVHPKPAKRTINPIPGISSEDGGSDWEEIQSDAITGQPCAMCNSLVIIDTVKSVQEHLIVDHKKRPPYRQGDQQGTFKCLFCDYLTKYKHNVLKHMKYQHMKLADPDNFRCKKCSYSCTYKSQIIMHVKQVHKKIKDWKCNFCNYSCSSNATLKAHVMRTHSEEKRYNCELCGYSCDNKKPLSQHIESTHPDHQIRHCNQILNSHHNNGGRERVGACKFACATVERLAEHSRVEHAQELSDSTAGNLVFSKVRTSGVGAASSSSQPQPPPPVTIKRERRLNDNARGAYTLESNRGTFSEVEVKRERKQKMSDRTYSLPPGVSVTKAGKVITSGKLPLPAGIPPSPPLPTFEIPTIKREPEIVDLE